MAATHMIDKRGNTVTVAQLTTDTGTRQVFVARTPNGILMGRYLGDGVELTTTDDLVRAGIDLASLKPVTA